MTTRFFSLIGAVLLVAIAPVGAGPVGPKISITILPTTVMQDFNTLPSAGSATWTNNTTLPGWYHARTGTGTTIAANDGATPAGGLYSFGTGTNAERALGSIGSNGAGDFYWGILLTNNTGSVITTLAVTYTGEQWNNSAAAAQTVSFSYLVGTGLTGGLADFQSAGVSVASLDFTSPITGGSAGALDGNAAANRVAKTFTITGLSVANGQDILLRWADPNHTGADHALAIDDLSVTADTGGATPTPTATATASPTATPTATPGTIAIHDIQGNGSTSPLVGQVLTTSGIVTGLRSNGFFLQTPDANADADPNTSEGIFVFTSSTPPAAATIGNSVNVTGTVQEFIPSADPNSPPATEIGGSISVNLLSTGNPLPAAITITAAETLVNDVNNLEKFEGMRVHVDSLTVVAPTQGFITESSATSSSNGVFLGVITGVSRPMTEPGIPVIAPVPTPAPPNVPRFDTNPERLRIDSDAQPGSAAIEVSTGAVVTNITGVLDYAFDTYTILPDAATLPGVTGNISAVPVPTPSSTQLTVGSSNLERFYDTTDDAGVSDVVLTATAFNNRLNKASLAIRNFMQTPDVVGIEEMEKLSTLQALATKINNDAVAAAQPNPNYAAFLVEGNDVGGIDVGFLVKTARVTVIDVTQFGLTDTYINPNNGQPELLNDRPPLILRATIQDEANQPFAFTVIVNHLRSLNGVDDPADGNRVRTKRRAQAEYLANLVQSRQTADPTEKMILVGDFNAFQFNDGYVDVIGTIKGTPAPADQVVLASSDLVNPDLAHLANTLPVPQRYSYSFGGNAEILDHVMVTSNLLPRVAQFAYARFDADYPDSFRNDPNRPERISDHDAPVTYISLSAATPSPTPTATATATPTATATATPTATATATPTATATATPTATATAMPTATATATPTSTPTATATPASTPTATPASTPTATPPTTRASQPLNLSTRMRVLTGDNIGIGGFIIIGSAPKHLLLRAIGPSLGQFGVPDPLSNPVLELHGPNGFTTVANDDWKDDPAQRALIFASGIPPTNDFESAIDASLAPGAYTALISGKNNTSGAGLIELYDRDQAALSRLANISTRAFVNTGDDLVIAGFILGNSGGMDRIAVRGLGPSLTAAGVPNALPNPTLELRDGNGALLVANDNWQDDSIQAAELTANGLSLTNNLESGIVQTLPPGIYTALLRGSNNSIGVGLVEVYDLEP